jgi:hypothetical protein
MPLAPKSPSRIKRVMASFAPDNVTDWCVRVERGVCVLGEGWAAVGQSLVMIITRHHLHTSPHTHTRRWAVFDPLAIVCLFVFTVATGCLGIWQLALGNDGSNNNSFALGPIKVRSLSSLGLGCHTQGVCL